MPIRVYYADTDAGGVVYHSVYLEFAERCRTEMLRHLGWPLVGPEGEMFVVRRAELDWLRPARLEQVLTCRTTVQEIGGASVQMRQAFYGDDTLLCEIAITLVHVSAALRPARLPDGLRAAFGTCMAP